MAGGFVYDAIGQTEIATAEIYGKAIADIMLKDPKVVAITADLAKSTKLGDVLKVCPERVINVGIAEQDMMGVAAGMAKAGMIPFVSGFSAFTSMRSCDQVHTDICYQKANVKIVATHSGTSFGQAGSTHHAIVDLAIIRSMPNMTLIVPADGFETANAVNAAYATEGPFYIRINRGFDLVVYDNMDYGFEVGKAVTLNEGTDITVIACGSCVAQAKKAAEFLKNSEGLSVRVLNMHTIKPIDKEAILKAVTETRRIITVEDHVTSGGLGSAVAEVVVDSGKACAFKMLGHSGFAMIGLQEDIMADAGIDANGIVAAVHEVMKKDFEEDNDWDDEY